MAARTAIQPTPPNSPIRVISDWDVRPVREAIPAIPPSLGPRTTLATPLLLRTLVIPSVSSNPHVSPSRTGSSDSVFREMTTKVVGIDGGPVYCVGLRAATPGPPRGDPQCPHPRCPLHALWPRTRTGAWLSVSPRRRGSVDGMVPRGRSPGIATGCTVNGGRLVIVGLCQKTTDVEHKIVLSVQRHQPIADGRAVPSTFTVEGRARMT